MLSQDLIAKIEADLDDLPLEPKGRRELNTLLLQVGEKIRAAQGRGASYVEIARQITASGDPIKPSTLRAGMDRQRKSSSSVKISPRRRRDKGPSEQRGSSLAFPAEAPPKQAVSGRLRVSTIASH